MIYIIFANPEKKESSCHGNWGMRVFVKFLRRVLPMANPDYDNLFDKVVTWLVEYDENRDYPNREIGIDKYGKVIIASPFGDNLGYWTDTSMTLNDFRTHFAIEYTNKNFFENLWSNFHYTQ